MDQRKINFLPLGISLKVVYKIDNIQYIEEDTKDLMYIEILHYFDQARFRKYLFDKNMKGIVDYVLILNNEDNLPLYFKNNDYNICNVSEHNRLYEELLLQFPKPIKETLE